MGLRPAAAVALAVALLAGIAVAPGAQGKVASLEEAHARSMEFLAGQGGDGPYPAGLAPYAVEAAHAAGLDPATWPEASRAALDSVAVPPDDASGGSSGGASGESSGGSFLSLVRPAYALALAGRLDDWRGEDVGQRLRAGFDGRQFGDPALLNDDLFAGLALVADGASVADPQVAAVADFFVANQGEDGGWGYAVGGRSSVDTTAMAVLFLERAYSAAEPSDASGASADAAIERAIGFVLSAQDPMTHGFAEEPGGEPNCDSTAWALRIEAGARDGRVTGWDYLMGLQNGDGGFAYKPGQPSNTLCTVEAATVLGDALRGRIGVPPGAFASNESPAVPFGLAGAILLLAARRFRAT